MFRNTAIVLSFAALIALAGCAQAPQQAIDGANAALEAARTAEAPEYAPAAWQLAQDSLSSAMTEVQAQNDKFALMRSYDEATQLLDKATQSANAAAAEAATAREEAKQRAEAVLAEAQAALDAAVAALATAPKGKGTEADLMAMKAEIEAMTASLATAREAAAGGKYLVAESSAQSIRDQANQIVADIEQAKGKRRA
jgi:hypothetical protein